MKIPDFSETGVYNNSRKNTLIPSAEKLISRYDMLPAGTHVLCALSGGRDSVCLLHYLASRPEITVTAAHFNHCLRGEESDRDEAFCTELCKSLGIPFVTERGNVILYSFENSVGIEAAARTLRYRFLEQTAHAIGADKIALAHHAHDNAETVLMNWIRGAGLHGMAGMPPVRGKFIRPFLDTDRAELVEYLERYSISYVDDSTNFEDDTLRNRLRHMVLPLLFDENAEAIAHISSAAELLREDEECLNSMAADYIKRQSGDVLSVPQLLKLQKPVAMRVLHAKMPDSSRVQLEAVYAMAQRPDAHLHCDVTGGAVEKERESLLIFPENSGAITDTTLSVPGITEISGTNLSIKATVCEVNLQEIHNSLNILMFQCENICGTITVTGRKPGDSFRPYGRKCTKTLKQLMTERKIPLNERDRIPVFRDFSGIIGVAGFGCDERVAPQRSGKILKIEITERHAGGVEW